MKNVWNTFVDFCLIAGLILCAYIISMNIYGYVKYDDLCTQNGYYAVETSWEGYYCIERYLIPVEEVLGYK